MASSAKQFSFFLLFVLLSTLQIHARDSQFFNKVTSTNGNTVLPDTKQPLNNEQTEQPNFLPDNESGYGLYGHESGQLPPSATVPTTTTTTTPHNTESEQPLSKHLPKNYNPVAYVTVPEDMDDSSALTEEKSYATNPTNYYNGAQNYYNGQQEVEESEYRSYPASTNTNNRNNYYYNGGSRFNSLPQGLSDTMSSGGGAVNSRENYFNNGGNSNGFQPQGMSDTRYLENGKYFYDINTEKYSSNHPYERLRGVRPTNEYSNRNYYGNNEFNHENFMGGYQNQEQFQNEENNMP